MGHMAASHLLRLLFVSLIAGIACKSYDGYKLVRFEPKSDREVQLLTSLIPENENSGISFWTEPKAVNQSVDVLLSPEKLDEVTQFSEQNEIQKPKVIVEDVQKLMMSEEKVHSRMRQGPSSSMLDADEFFNDFRRLNIINSFMDRLAQTYPQLAVIDSIGQTSEGRDMRILRIGSNSGPGAGRQGISSKPIFWIDAGIHAREWVAPPTALFLAYALLSQYDKAPDIKRIVDAFEWHILPVANPDGYEYTHTTDRFWRKTRSRNSYSACMGTDPNRNFGFHWRESGASSNPCSETFAGAKAFSEPEAVNIANHLWRNRRRTQVYLTFHSYSQLWLTPWGFTNDLPSDYKDLYNKARRAADAVEKVYGTKYRVGTSTRILYAAAGGSDDWAKGVAGIPYAYTVELRPSSSAYRGFVVSPSEIKPCAIEMLAGVIQLAKDISGNSNRNGSRTRAQRG